MWAPVSPRSNRIASAQPPAKAAPNTSAPIRIAAEITVMTLLQTIWRRAEVGSMLMARCPMVGGNVVEKGRTIKRKKAKKARSDDIDSAIFSATKRTMLMSETQQAASTAPAEDNPLLKGWETPHQTPPFHEIAPEHF